MATITGVMMMRPLNVKKGIKLESSELKKTFVQVGEKSTNKSDTVARRLILSDLQPGTTYELVRILRLMYVVRGGCQGGDGKLECFFGDHWDHES